MLLLSGIFLFNVREDIPGYLFPDLPLSGNKFAFAMLKRVCAERVSRNNTGTRVAVVNNYARKENLAWLRGCESMTVEEVTEGAVDAT